MNVRCRFARFAALALAIAATTPFTPAAAQDRYPLSEGENVGVMGNAFAEHMARSGYFEALVQAAHPDANITVRSVPWSGDEVGLRIREHSVPVAEARLQEYGSDVVFMYFGMSESFSGDAGLERFEQQLAAHIDDYQGRQFNGESAPRLVLVSPIAHEDLGAPLPTGAEVADHNASLAAYTEVMRSVAEQKGVRFIDLFAPSQRLYAAHEPTLTSNGIHPNELGCFYFAKEIGTQLGWMTAENGIDNDQAADALRTLAFDKFYHERLIYAATNTEYVWGRRRDPFGSVNFPEEEAQLNRMVGARQAAMWALDKPSPVQLFANAPSGPAVWEATPTSSDFPEDEWTPTPVELIDRGGSIGSLDIKTPEEFIETFTLADGYIAECFASEQDFEELACPLALTFDDRGRLWVLVSPTYPHVLPGQQPDCKILILEDTDADGKADDLIVFAHQLDIPTGFAIDGDGVVYVGQAPYLYKLTDTDGDSIADRKETIYTGFGMPDSHHTISAFVWEPGGTILMHEGVFTRTNVETPRGTQRTHDAAVWRFDPRTLELTAIAHTGHPNPWGHTIDQYGHGIMMDTSGAYQYNFAHLASPFVYPHKPGKPGPVVSRGRPTSGSEIIYSRHFPDDVQGTYLSNNVIGFHGTFWDRLNFDGEASSGYTSERMPKDLIQSSDENFRPVGCEIAPDGTLYIIDWCNPLIGHMQFSVRDPRRDHSHGRVWRIRHADRPLVDAPDVANASNEQLLEILRTYEQGPRDRARRRLQRADPAVVLPMLDEWLEDLDDDSPDYARLMLEGLWIHQAHGSVNVDLLEEVLDLDNAAAVAGGVRVLRYWLQLGEIAQRDADRRIRRLTDHDDMRVRLELVMACAYLADADDARDYMNEIAEMPMDAGLQNALQESLKYLNDRPAVEENDQVGDNGASGDGPIGIGEKLRLLDLPAEALMQEAAEHDAKAAVALERPDVPFLFASRR
ncbi:MAG: PVC-type heme-binding CxxCH protein [Phycisphaerales bacterium JB063]